jgi:hypothetical protein
MRTGRRSWVVVAVALVTTLAASPSFALTACRMRFDLDGWSVFYQASDGEGVVECDNGQRAKVRLEGRGGGITFGRSAIVDGAGRFSLIADIDEIFGNYGNAEAHAGLGASSKAQVLTKGSVSLTLSGTGSGLDLGFAFGRFTIRPAEHRERQHERRVDEDDIEAQPPREREHGDYREPPPVDPRDREYREAPPRDDDGREPPPSRDDAPDVPPPPPEGY